MVGRKNMAGEAETCGGVGTFMVNLIPVVTLLAIGCPLALTAIRAIVVGRILIVVGFAHLIFRHHFQPAPYAATVKTNRSRNF